MALDNPKFQESYARLFGKEAGMGGGADDFYERFYELFLADPYVAGLFRDTDMARQVAMLKKSLLNVVSFYLLDEPTPELTRLAEIHRAVGVTPSMFDAWLEALVQVVAEHDPDCDDATRLAWCWALTPGITYMRLKLSDAF